MAKYNIPDDLEVNPSRVRKIIKQAEKKSIWEINKPLNLKI